MAVELVAFKVITLLPVAGLEENVAVTPLGKPDAARVTPPVKQADCVGVMVTVPLLPSAIDRAAGEDVSKKLSEIAPSIVRAIGVVASSEPETPVIAMLYVPTLTAQPVVSMSTLLPVVGLVPKVAVTPLGRPEAARVTLPLNGLMSVTLMVSVMLLPGPIVRAVTEGVSVKPPP